MFKTKIILLAAMILCVSCEKEKRSAIEKAMDQYEEKNYVEALASYQALISTKGSIARVGAGWCKLKLEDYLAAYSFFNEAGPDSLPEGFAGWSLACWAQKNYQGAIEKSEVALRLKPNFKSGFDGKFSSVELIWLQASCYFFLNDYSKTVNKIKQLPGQSNYNPDLQSDNISHELLVKLESLSQYIL